MSRVKVYMDSEFTGLHQNTTLISIGLISECGKTFYAEFNDYSKEQTDDWLQKNVIDKLYLNIQEGGAEYSSGGREDIKVYGNTDIVKTRLEEWLSQFGDVEMWSDLYAYDWMLFNQIWGHAFNIPKNVYYIPLDLSTLLYAKGIDPDINREKFAFGEVYQEMIDRKHTALWDAKVIKECCEKLFAMK